jgi:hypothetical protein
MIKDGKSFVFDEGFDKVFIDIKPREGVSEFGVKNKMLSIELRSPSSKSREINPCSSFIERVQKERARENRNESYKQVSFRLVDKIWCDRKVSNGKMFTNVAMSKRDKDRLVGDISMFLEHKEVYRSKGLAWNRGYIFHGPPGCGKSSCIAAISNEFKLPMYNLDLRDIENDTDLRKVFASLPERIIVVIEDIDCMIDTVLVRNTNDTVVEKKKEKIRSDPVEFCAVKIF